MLGRAVAGRKNTSAEGQNELLSAFVSGRVMARALSEATEERDRIALARGFCVRLVDAWWTALTASDSRPQLLREPIEQFDCANLPEAVAALADSLGATAAEFDAESAAHHIGLAYTGMLPREYRGSLGIYYTPPALTKRIIAQATEAGVDWTRCRVLDPACGGGAFLAPVAQRILEALSGCSPRILIENLATRIRGYEIDPFGAWLSQVTLDAILLPIYRETGRRLPVVVSVCDALRRRPPRDRFDLVIGNPPYGRVRLSREQRDRFKRSLYGHANLYGLFTDQALRFAKTGGIIAYVTPTSFLAGEYFKNLRATLGRYAPPVSIDFVSLRKDIFEDVLQETVLATYRKGETPGKIQVHEVRPNGHNQLAIETVSNCCLPADFSKPWLLPRTVEQARLFTKIEPMPYRLADWGYKVSTGPLVWNRYKDQLSNQFGKNHHPLIWAEAITSEGTFIWRAEKKNHTLYFEACEGDDWLITDQSCVLLQRTTAKEQSRRLIATVLPDAFLMEHGSVVVENHLNMLRPIIEQPVVSPEVLVAFLKSAVADRVFRCVSGSVAVSAYELEAMPLPDPDKLDELAVLVEAGASVGDIEAVCIQSYEGVV